jgi:hypothetical protein
MKWTLSVHGKQLVFQESSRDSLHLRVSEHSGLTVWQVMFCG